MRGERRTDNYRAEAKRESTLSPSPAADHDWTKPGVYPAADGIHRMPLPLPLKGLPAVNVYVLEGIDGPVVIDSGWQSPETRAELQAGLGELGHRVQDVDTFVISHMHWDHYTMAVELQREFGCKILVGGDDHESISTFDPTQGLYPHMLSQLRSSGAEEIATAIEQRPLESYETDIAYGLPDRWLADGDRISVFGGELESIATPGHTRGHMTFALDSAGVLFTGDHVLPIATPAIGGDGVPAADPLGHYLASLNRLLERPDAVMLPAHGPAGGSVHARVHDLIEHHDERLREILQLVADGRETAAQVAADLPWTRRNRQLDTLDVVHQMHAILEVDAHLQVLERHGTVQTAVNNGVCRYRQV